MVLVGCVGVGTLSGVGVGVDIGEWNHKWSDEQEVLVVGCGGENSRWCWCG